MSYSKISKAIEPRWILVVIFFLSGIFLGGIGLYLWFGLYRTVGYKIHSTNPVYKFINPLIAVEFNNSNSFSINKSLELQIRGLVDESQKNQQINTASVYFRDIEPAYWAGVNENAKFSPGNLLKIPIMISYFKLAENDPQILQKKLKNTSTQARKDDPFPSATPLVFGETYSVNELIRRMIVDGDDVAAILLYDNIDNRTLNEVYSDLGIDFVENNTTTSDYISLKLYSLFFRVLYNSTYLNREYSEQALSLLSQTNTNVGISATLPKESPIAQEFDAHAYTENGISGYEMYDCGIIYYPNHPYLLCASVKGKTLKNIEGFLKSLSQRVYSEMDYKYK